MRYSVVLRPEARQDLKEIKDYIQREAGQRIAREFVHALRHCVAELAVFPKRGRVRQEAESDLRVIGFRRRVSIHFRVEADRVVILAFRYAGRNWTSEYSELDDI